MNFIHRTSQGKGTYNHIFLVCKKMEAFNRFLQDELGRGITIITDLSKVPKVRESFEELSDKNNKSYLFIFDDCISDKGKIGSVFEEYFTYGRAYGLQCIFLSQSYFQTNIYIRKQCSWIILCGIRSNGDLNRILNDHSFGDINAEQMIRIYEYCKEEDPNDPDDISFMKICTFQCPKNKKISRNWLDYIEPKEFK